MNRLKRWLVCVFCILITVVYPASAQDPSRKRISVTAVVLKNFPPNYIFENGQPPSGFAIEILEKVALSAGLQVKYQFKENWGEVLSSLENGQADLCPFIAFSPERQKELDFTSPLLKEQMVLVVRKTTGDISGLADLSQRKVGVIRKSAAWDFLKERKDLILVQMEKAGQALFDLLSGQVEAIAVPEQVIQTLARKAGVGGHIKIVGQPLTELTRAMAVRKGNRELWQRLDPAVRSCVASSEYPKIYTRWYGSPQAYWTPERIIWIMSALLIACLLAMALWRYVSITKLNRQLLATMEERRKAEEEARTLAKRFQMLLEIAGDGIHIHDLEGHLVESSESFRRMLGYTKEEAGGLNIVDWDAYFNKEDFLKRFKSQSGKPLVFETKHRRQDGTEFSVEVVSKTIQVDGQPYIYSSSRDITERKRLEEALRETERRYRDLFENANMAIFKSTVEGKAVTVNPAFARIFGYASPEEFMALVKNVVSDLFADPGRRAEILRMQIENPRLNSFESLYRRKDGSTFWGRLNVRSIRDRDDQVISYEGFIEDITKQKAAEEEKRKLEEQLQRAEKMEALGTLAGGVAHDLNNVLGIIVGYAELLLYDLDEASPLKAHLKNIMEGSQKAAAIVQDLLTLARRGVAHRTVVNTNRIILDTQKSPEFEKLAAQHPMVEIKTDLEPDLLNISGSSVHLSKALFNLMSNASEAMPNGGRVAIKTANQYLDRPIQGYDEVREGDYVVLSVSDTGEGISPADLKRIFEPFYTKKVMGRSGTGLGLAVVWGTVKDHQGYINVQSEEGKGSTFTLYFPVIREELSKEPSHLSIAEYQGKGEKILIVDDVQGQRDLAKEMLRKLHYKAISCSSGEEAVDYLKEHPVDLVVLDMIMSPGMDGLETYQEILKIRPSQKAVIVSGFSESDRVHAAQALGAGTYVKKPYVLEKLGLAVRQELDRTS
jgi:PAS domain S-box-containing protein